MLLKKLKEKIQRLEEKERHLDEQLHALHDAYLKLEHELKKEQHHG